MQIATLAANAAFPGVGAISAINSPVSLDNMLKAAVMQCDATAQSGLVGIKNELADSRNVTNPAALLSLQKQIQDYSIYVTYASTLARKGVSTVETLVKGQ